jgi:mono/diheme cytochrome c family protein
MFSRFRIAMGMALFFALAFAFPVFAGGWAVITLDELPTDVVAGEPLTIGFTVLQHGRTPMNDLKPTITATLSQGSQFVVNAESDGKPGHYTATLTFPKEGDWSWSIQAFSMDQLMPVLTVAAPMGGVADQPVAKSEPVITSIPLISIVRVAALGIGLVALVFAFRRKSRLAIALTALCLLIGVGSFATASGIPAVEAQSKSSSVTQVELGRQLFVAKGCITCHANNKVARASEYWMIEAGPNLTKFSASPEALRLRLKDPLSVKSDTKMPNLNLSEAEIEALIAFINSK